MRTGGARIILGALALITVMSACAGAQPANQIVGSRRFVVEVTNHNWMDMAVYALAGGVRVRLGTVTTFGRERYFLPLSLAEGLPDLRLEAQAIGSDEAIRSDLFLVAPGTRLSWTLENQKGLSSQYIDSR